MIRYANSKKFSIIAAVCFAAVSVYYAIYTFIPVPRLYSELDKIPGLSNHTFNPEYGYYAFLSVISYSKSGHYCFDFINILIIVTAIGLSVTLFMKNIMGFTMFSGLRVLLSLYCIISRFTVFYLFDLLGCSVVLVILIMIIKQKPLAKKIWFVGSAFLFIALLIMWLTAGFFGSLSRVWLQMLVALIDVTGFVFMGLWIKNGDFSAYATQVNEYAVFNPQSLNDTASLSGEIGGANDLKDYKEKLDSGVITQEEYDEKKKQILGL